MIDFIFLKGACTDLKPVFTIIKTVMTFIYIAVPILLLLWGSFDLIKAVVASDAKKMQEGWTTLLKRAIYAVVIFLLGTLVTAVFGNFVTTGNFDSCGFDQVNTK